MDIFSFIVSNETVGLILLWSSAAILAVLLLDLAGFVTVSWKFFTLAASCFFNRILKTF